MNKNLTFRYATPEDVDKIADLEAACFPAAEAATHQSIADRVKAYPTHFFLLCDGDRVISFVNGLVTDEPDLTDEMYERADMNQEDGAWLPKCWSALLMRPRNRGARAWS